MNNFLYAAEKQIDTKGWGEAQWGMTKDQLLEAFKGQAIEIPKELFVDHKTYKIAIINDYIIDGTRFTVTFFMSIKDDKLQRVHLRSSPSVESKYLQFQKLFIEKYGPPNLDKENREGFSRTLVSTWFLTSSKIELTYLYYPHDINMAFLVVWYDDNKSAKSTLDKL